MAGSPLRMASEKMSANNSHCFDCQPRCSNSNTEDITKSILGTSVSCESSNRQMHLLFIHGANTADLDIDKQYSNLLQGVLMSITFMEPQGGMIKATIVRVLKVLGDLLGHFSPPSPESGQNSGPDSVPGLLEQFLAGSTKSAPNHLAGPTKIPLPKNPPERLSIKLLMQCNFFQCYLVNSICIEGR